ncbi:hypothetical protein TTHERM_001679239 (macronuclear) [Tetrahymena thermophila SB210]|uniref:Uncharacterized protein n=1 Tax=Tetrahymena thermophila (strain SB210) TaxID=312017 RepID=W7XCR2_TETTS|nr:hypothetical protein TTHERM_001679239 [Tetrahymena thermophila SB210]EWS71581.1 hypothetical protein TTHERM_001679239 [Tetrahymena thermophila SB210]|eukprot:XP_012655885.1 hypothetical protein TTHERM_001679239 [Tetrahymena thermophila SB210]
MKKKKENYGTKQRKCSITDKIYQTMTMDKIEYNDHEQDFVLKIMQINKQTSQIILLRYTIIYIISRQLLQYVHKIGTY